MQNLILTPPLTSIEGLERRDAVSIKLSYNFAELIKYIENVESQIEPEDFFSLNEGDIVAAFMGNLHDYEDYFKDYIPVNWAVFCKHAISWSEAYYYRSPWQFLFYLLRKNNIKKEKTFEMMLSYLEKPRNVKREFILNNLSSIFSQSPNLTELRKNAEELVNKLDEKFDVSVDFNDDYHTIITSNQGNQLVAGKTTEKVKEIFASMEQNQPVGIKYNHYINTGEIKRGVCSALALGFARRYIEIKNDRILKKNDLFFKLRELISEEFYPGITTTSLNQKLMDTQAAFNCIEVDKSLNNIDFSLAKVQSIAGYFSFAISSYTEETKYSDSISPTLNKQITEMPHGVHLLRFIKSNNNEKLEKYGHSMIFIKDRQGNLFYDPNNGVELITNNPAERLCAHLKHNQIKFKLDTFRFYALTPLFPMYQKD